MANYTASRTGLKVLVTPVKPTLHRRLKIFAAQSDSTLENVCRAAFEKYLSAVAENVPLSTSA
jgi:hypothetical protein